MRKLILTIGLFALTLSPVSTLSQVTPRFNECQPTRSWLICLYIPVTYSDAPDHFTMVNKARVKLGNRAWRVTDSSGLIIYKDVAKDSLVTVQVDTSLTPDFGIELNNKIVPYRLKNLKHTWKTSNKNEQMMFNLKMVKK